MRILFTGFVSHTYEPGNDTVYWTPGDDIPKRAYFLYYVYEDGKVIKIGLIWLVLTENRGGVVTL